MTAIALARLPLVLMLMTSEAHCHGRTQGDGLGFGNTSVTLHAITMNGGHVLSMIETQMLARHLCTLSCGYFTVTKHAVALIMRFFVAFATLVRGRQMDGPDVVGGRDAGVAAYAAHAFVDVRAMLERMRLRGLSKTEHARAGRERQG